MKCLIFAVFISVRRTISVSKYGNVKPICYQLFDAINKCDGCGKVRVSAGQTVSSSTSSAAVAAVASTADIRSVGCQNQQLMRANACVNTLVSCSSARPCVRLLYVRDAIVRVNCVLSRQLSRRQRSCDRRL